MSIRTFVVVALLLIPLAAPLGAAGPWDDVPPECVNLVGVDVLFLFDLTGSMGGVLASAKAEAINIMADLQVNVTDIRFGSASHMDYVGFYSYPGYATTYGSGADYPWALGQDLTTNTSLVNGAINALSLGFGNDWPEDYTRALYEAGESVSWGPTRLKLVVFFGDAEPHDLDFVGNTGGDPGRDAVALNGDDLDFQTMVDGLEAKGIRVLGVDSGAASATMSYLARETDGAWFSLGSTAGLRAAVVDMIQDQLRNDDEPPTAAFVTPPGIGGRRSYVDGIDSGASPTPEHAIVQGDLGVSLLAADNCLLERVDYYVSAASYGSATTGPFGWAWDASAFAPGLYTLRAVATDWTGLTTTIETPVRILALAEGGRALGAWAGTNVPVSAEASVGGAATLGPSGTASNVWFDRVVGPPGASMQFVALRDEANATRTGALASSSEATSLVTHVSLLDGLVTADAVRARSVSTFDGATLSGASSSDGSSIVGLRVANVPVEVPATGMTIPIPGVGRLAVFEVEPIVGATAAQQVNMLHLFLDTPSVKGEIIVASARSAAGYGADEILGLHRAIDDRDDAGTDGDAGDSAATATPLTPGTYAGFVEPTDLHDVYAFGADDGTRIVLGLESSPRVIVSSSAAPDVFAGTAIPQVVLRLMDPDRVVRDVGGGLVDRIEFHADKLGTWYAWVDHLGGQRVNYSLSLALPPIVFYPQIEGGAQGDAPDACAGGLPIDDGVWPGVLRRDDWLDAYRFPVEIGEIVSVVLKPDDLDDGADFDLSIYGPDCELLAYSRSGLEALAKATPEAAVQLPALRTGMYGAIVHRINGVGNYDLLVGAVTPMPTLPANDALSGRDSSGPGDAIPILATGAFQGRFEEGDASDWYVLTRAAAKTLRVAADPSALSSLTLRVYDAGLVLQGSAVGAIGPALLMLPAGAGGVTYVEIVRGGGGGNYMLALAEADR